MPVLGSGHPQADVFLLKYAPMPSEIEEGVAFYGRAGGALMKSFKRLGIDPLAVYGTLVVKCPVADTDLSAPECRARVLEELTIVQPRIVVAMGEEALAEQLERARDQTVEHARVVVEDGRVELQLQAEGDVTVSRWAAQRQADLFRRAFGRELSVTT